MICATTGPCCMLCTRSAPVLQFRSAPISYCPYNVHVSLLNYANFCARCSIKLPPTSCSFIIVVCTGSGWLSFLLLSRNGKNFVFLVFTVFPIIQLFFLFQKSKHKRAMAGAAPPEAPAGGFTPEMQQVYDAAVSSLILLGLLATMYITARVAGL